MLSPMQVITRWEEIEPLLALACDGNGIARMELTPEEILRMTQEDECILFQCFGDSGETDLVFGVQFFMTGPHKSADIVAMGGRNLRKHVHHFWPSVVEWLRLNGVKYIDAYVDTPRAEVFKKLLGFDTSCAYIRRTL